MVGVKDKKNHDNKGWREGLSLIFKQRTKQNYVIQKQKTQKLRTRTWDVQNKHENMYLLC
jgi:hypothetical protein